MSQFSQLNDFALLLLTEANTALAAYRTDVFSQLNTHSMSVTTAPASKQRSFSQLNTVIDHLLVMKKQAPASKPVFSQLNVANRLPSKRKSPFNRQAEQTTDTEPRPERGSVLLGPHYFGKNMD